MIREENGSNYDHEKSALVRKLPEVVVNEASATGVSTGTTPAPGSFEIECTTLS